MGLSGTQMTFLKTKPEMTFFKPQVTHHKNRTKGESKTAVIDYLVSLGFPQQDAEAWCLAYHHTFQDHPLQKKWDALEDSVYDYATYKVETYKTMCEQMKFIETLLEAYKDKMGHVRQNLFTIVEEKGADPKRLNKELTYGVSVSKLDHFQMESISSSK